MKTRNIIFIFCAACMIASCKKEKTFLYEVDSVIVESNGGIKNNVKSTTEFISIAYADLHGTNINSTELQNLSIVYTAFGDKKLIEDRIIRQFLNDVDAIIPSSISVGGDTTVFIINTYKKFFNRLPNEFERYYFRQLFRLNPTVNARIIYYSMMTSDEYRYY